MSILASNVVAFTLDADSAISVVYESSRHDVYRRKNVTNHEEMGKVYRSTIHMMWQKIDVFVFRIPSFTRLLVVSQLVSKLK